MVTTEILVKGLLITVLTAFCYWWGGYFGIFSYYLGIVTAAVIRREGNEASREAA